MKLIAFILCVSCLTFISKAQSNYFDSIQSIRTEHYNDLFKPDNLVLNNEEKEKIKSLDYFPIDTINKLNAVFTLEIGKLFALPTSSGTDKAYRKYGYLSFTWNNEPQKLYVYQDIKLSKRKGFEDHLIIPFKDVTSAKETYGGGRYIDFKIPTTTNVVLDFNLAYNPYCAYSHRFSCPIPPKENHLKISITAGEKTPIENE